MGIAVHSILEEFMGFLGQLEQPQHDELISSLWMNMGMDSIPIDTFLVGWTSIYQLFWCSPGVQGFDTLPYKVQPEFMDSS